MGRRKPTIRETFPTLRQIFVRFSPFIRKERWLIGGSTACLLSEVIFRLLEPWPLKFVLDRVLMPTADGGKSGVAFVDALSPMTVLTLSAVAIVIFAFGRATLSYGRRVGYALAGSRVLAECRAELFAHLQRLSLSFHHKNRSGDLITRITGDIGRVKEVVITAAMPLVAQAITLVGMMAVMIWMDWRLALLAVEVMPLVMLSTRRLGGRIRKVARKQRERKGAMGATAAEVMGSIKVVQAMSLEDVHQRAFTAQNKSDLKEGVKAKRLSARLIGTTDVLIAVSTALVLWFGTQLVLREVLTAGDLIVFLAYLKSAFRPLRDMAKYTGRIAKATASAERIVEILDTTPVIRNRPGAVDLPVPVESLHFDDVTFGYEPEKVALEGFNLRAVTGQVVAFAGPSGAGKSTVVNMMLRLYDPHSGRVQINGRDIREYTIETLRRAIAVVPQENVLFRVSARENIAYGAPEASEEEIVAAAKLARAHDFIMALPEGYDTVIGERGETLSEGQRQRIAIARAVIRAAPILVLDEPTSSLDNENNRLVREALHDLRAGRMTFIVAHDLSTVEEADLVVFLDHGRIVEQGTHAELVERGGRYAAMYALQEDRMGPGPGKERVAHAVGG